MAKKDYYGILGVSKESSKDEIKKSYKKLALKYHPDRASEDDKKDSEKKFKEISEAYAVLSDDEKRKQYDMFGQNNFNQQYNQEGIFRGTDFSSIFEEIFNGGFSGGGFNDFFGGQRIRRGRDLKYELDLDFEEAVFGCEKKINLNKNINCEDCLGTGAENQELKRCDECGGAGEKVVSRKTPFGIFNQVMICKVCEGTGEVPKKKCKSCNGQGVIKKTKTITVKIPKGINNGQILRVSGKGESIKNGESGDLLVVMNVKPHEFFKREGDDIYSTLPISFSQAVLGGEIIVQTLYGETKIKISPGIESGKVLRLKGKGVENVEGWRVGDYFIQIKIQTPKKINKKQKELFIELAKLEKDNSKSEKKFFKKFLNR